MEYNSIYKVEYEVFGDVKNISFSVLDEEIVTFENDILTAHKDGETVLTCTYNKKEQVDINVKVLERGKQYFEVGDPSLNEANYQLLKEDLDSFSETLNESNYLSMDIATSINGQKAVQSVRAINDPFYIEALIGDEYQIIAQEGNKVFSYTQVYSNYFERDYLGTVDKYEGSNSQEDSEEILEVTFDKEKCNVTYEDNTYTITCLYKDAVNEESKELIAAIYRQAGLSITTVYESVLTTKYVFYDKKVYISTSMVVDFEFLSQPIDMCISYEIDVNEFTPIDMLNGEYEFSTPDCYEEVYEVFNFDKEITIKDRKDAYLKVEVERGMIVTDSEEVSFELYDMNKQLVSESMGKTGNSSYIKLDSFVAVPESGTYYLKVRNRLSGNHIIRLEHYQYDTVYNSNGIDISSVPSYEGEIEGKYDFEKFIYNNESIESYSWRVKNTGSSTIAFFQNRKSMSDEIVYVKPNEVKYFTLKKGYNEILICQDFFSYDKKDSYEYSFESNILEFALDGNVYEEDIPSEINLSKYEARYYYSYLEKGQYSIVSTSGTSWSQKIVVYDKDGNLVDANVVGSSEYLKDLATHFVINESNYYYVGIINNSSGEYTMRFSKYDYETIIDRNNPKTLDVSGVNSNEGYLEGCHDFEYYTLENNSDEIKVYCITNNLDTNFTIVYREYQYASLTQRAIGPDEKIYFASYPGVMDFVICSNYKSNEEYSLNYSFKVTELVNKNVTDINSSQIPEVLETYSKDYIMTGYCLPAAYMKLNLKEKGIVTFDFLGYEDGLDFGINFSILNKNGEMMNASKDIPAGEYYVKFEGNDHIFSYAKVKYTFLSTDEKNINVTLKELDDTNNNEKYSDIYNEKVTTEQVVKYHFSLEEKTTIYYNSRDTVIYRKDGRQMVFIPVSYWNGGMTYVDLEAGDYYFVNPDMYGSTSSIKSPIYIGIKSKDRDAPQDLDNMVTLTLEQYQSFKMDYFGDCEYLKFIADEKARYKAVNSSGRCYLFNENLEYIGPADETKELEEGTYYIVVEYLTYGEKDVDIKVIKY